jgi:hypothetical protein
LACRAGFALDIGHEAAPIDTCRNKPSKDRRNVED